MWNPGENVRKCIEYQLTPEAQAWRLWCVEITKRLDRGIRRSNWTCKGQI